MELLKKNDIISLEIIDVTNEGNGVGKYDGMTIFVPDTAAGDRIECRIVKVQKKYCYGIIEKISEESPYRCDSECDSYGKCGGCCLRHMTYERELKEKQGFAEDAFRRIGHIDCYFDDILGAECADGYRNKAQFPVSSDDNGVLHIGFFARRSHRVVKVNNCRLLPQIFTVISNEIIDFCNSYGVTAYNENTKEGLLRHIYLRKGYHSNEIMAALVVTSFECKDLFKRLAKQLSDHYSDLKSFQLNLNDKETNVILGEKSEVLYGREFIYDTMCGNKIAISLHSFYQINTAQAERVYSLAAEYAQLEESDTLLDLYCGAGTIGLSMAKKVKRLIGVEIVSPAIENAKMNAELNGIDNAEFICSDAGKAAALLYQRGLRPDVIIADPARKGCTPDTLQVMADMHPKRIVMISCNPATAARDCAELEKIGYKVVKCRAVDFFPRTNHVETVCLLTRN